MIRVSELTQCLVRFIVGGVLVTAFASLGDVLKPKGFAGLFGAAPSIALASLVLAIHAHGTRYASLEARSMIIGAVAFVMYALTCVYLSGVRLVRAGMAASAAMAIWLTAAAIGLWLLRA